MAETGSQTKNNNEKFEAFRVKMDIVSDRSLNLTKNNHPPPPSIHHLHPYIHPSTHLLVTSNQIVNHTLMLI